MQKTIFYYNKNEIIEEKNESNGIMMEHYNVWIDVVDPSNEEISALQKSFH